MISLLQFRRRFAVDPSPEILELFRQAEEAEIKLARAAIGLEGDFLAISGDLERLQQAGDCFVKRVEKLVGIATGKDCEDFAFSNAIQLIERSTRYLSGCQSETEQMLKTLRGYEAQIGQLLVAEVELRKAMLPLKCVQTLFKVESAPLGPGFQQMFSALTQEMEGLHSQVRDIFGTKFKQLEQTRQTLARVTGQLDEQSRSLGAVIKTHWARVETSLAQLKEELASNRQRDVRLRRLSKDLSREVEQVVIGLQFQDIVNQKLQHIAEALPQIEEKFTADDSTVAGAGDFRFQFLRQSCRVEAGQLQSIQKELTTAEKAIRGGIERVLAFMKEADSQCLSLKEFAKLTTSCDGTVQVLVEIIEDVRKLVTATVASASEAYETLRPMGSLTADLTANVRAMSLQIRLIGLNAQVQAAKANQEQHGSGGLEVLSARTNEISEQTNRISETAARQLDELAEGLARAVKAFNDLRESGLKEKSTFDERAKEEETQLHALRDEALQTLGQVGQALDDIRQFAHQTLANINFAEFYEVTIPDLRAPLASLADTAERWLLSQRLPLEHSNLIKDFKRNYTMASEHRVMEGVMTGRPVAAEIHPVPGGAPPTNDPSLLLCAAASPAGELGANVELF